MPTPNVQLNNYKEILIEDESIRAGYELSTMTELDCALNYSKIHAVALLMTPNQVDLIHRILKPAIEFQKMKVEMLDKNNRQQEENLKSARAQLAGLIKPDQPKGDKK